MAGIFPDWPFMDNGANHKSKFDYYGRNIAFLEACRQNWDYELQRRAAQLQTSEEPSVRPHVSIQQVEDGTIYRRTYSHTPYVPSMRPQCTEKVEQSAEEKTVDERDMYSQHLF